MTLQQKRIVPKPLPNIKDYGPNAIDVNDLTFGYSSTGALDKFDEHNVLKNLNLTLKTGSRCLLIGANGSGKSTLLRILAGRHLTQQEVKVLGLNSFRETKLNFHRAYLNCDWGMTSIAFVGASVPLCADIPVHKMMVCLFRIFWISSQYTPVFFFGTPQQVGFLTFSLCCMHV